MPLIHLTDLENAATFLDDLPNPEEIGICGECMQGFKDLLRFGGDTQGVDTQTQDFKAGLLYGIGVGVRAAQQKADPSYGLVPNGDAA